MNHPEAMLKLRPVEAHVGQQGCVAADSTQTDEELQCGAQVLAPALVVDQGVPGILHLRPGDVVSVLPGEEQQSRVNFITSGPRLRRYPSSIMTIFRLSILDPPWYTHTHTHYRDSLYLFYLVHTLKYK